MPPPVTMENQTAGVLRLPVWKPQSVTGTDAATLEDDDVKVALLQ